MIAQSPEYLRSPAEASRSLRGWLERSPNRERLVSTTAVIMIIALLLSVVSKTNLGETLEYGGDEGCELVKADLVLHGLTPMKDFWSDQPPLHTYTIAFLFQVFGRDVIYPRMLSVLFAALLLLSLFTLARQRSNPLTGLIAAGIVVIAPSFSMLTVSVMSEMPAIAGCLFTMALLSSARIRGSIALAAVAGVILGVFAHLKLTVGLFLPAFLVAEALENRTRAGIAKFMRLYLTCAIFFTVVYLVFAYFAFNLNVSQLLEPHFNYRKMTAFDASTGSVTLVRTLLTDFLFDRFMVVAIAISLAAAVAFKLASARLPLFMMASVFAIHAVHKPYWIYYYIHLLIPAAWLIAEALVRLAAVGIGSDKESFQKFRHGLRFVFVVVAFCALAGVVLVDCGEKAERTSRLMARAKPAAGDHVLKAVKKHAPSTADLVFTLPSIYMFHADRRPPPELGVVSFKRMASDLRPDALAQTIVDTGVEVFACPESVLTYPRFWAIISEHFEQVERETDVVVLRRIATRQHEIRRMAQPDREVVE